MIKHKLPLLDDSHFTPILDRIREETSKILKIPFEKFFTDHSIEGHSTRILEHLRGLTGSLSDPLSEDEVYILVAAAYLHDISLAWENGMDFLELRKNHAKLSGVLIRKVGSGEQIEGIQCDFGLPHQSSYYAIHTEFIARVAEGHGGNTAGSYYDDTVLSSSNVRVRFLADLLAFADELDLHRERIDITRLAQSKMPLEEIFHWWKHWFITGVLVKPPCTVHISYAFPEEMQSDNDFPDLVQNYVNLRLKNEYAKVENTLAPENVRLHQHKPQRIFTALALPGTERPSDEIFELFRSAVKSLHPVTQTMLDPNEVSSIIEHATQYLMDGMLPAGVGDTLYVRRRDSEEVFEEFVERANEQLFLLAGRSGTGKTMFMRRMISKYPSFSLLYSYPGYNCETNGLPKHIVERYAAIIAGKLQQKKYRDLDIVKLEEIVKAKGKWVIIFIESNCSLNDLSRSEGLLHSLLLSIKDRNIKICLSCVADVGETFHVPDGLDHMLYQPDARMGVVAPSTVLKDYSEEEFRLACLRYFDERNIKASAADFVNEARDRLKNPMWLDIYSMARTDSKRIGIETSIRFVEVCESFLTNRSAKAAQFLNNLECETLIQTCLNKIAAVLIATPGITLEKASVKDIILEVFSEEMDDTENIFRAIKMAGLIKERSFADDPKGYISFAFVEIREYLIARQSAIEDLGWTSEITAEYIRREFFNVLKNTADGVISPYTVGVFEFFILLLEHAARSQEPVVLDLQQIKITVIDEMLWELANSEIEIGQQVCARVLGRLEKYPKELPQFIDKLSCSCYEKVRRDLTYSLSALSCEPKTIEEAFDARGVLLGLVDDFDESVACCAVMALIKSFENKTVKSDWIDKFMVIAQSNKRPLVITMIREFSRRTFPNINEFYPDILRSLCLGENSDYIIAATACDCLSSTGHLFAEEAFSIVRDTIEKFRLTRQCETVVEKAIPALISMEPYLQNDVYQTLEGFAKLKRNADLKSEIVRNYRKLSPNTREDVLKILEDDESSLVRILVSRAKNSWVL